MSLSSVLQCSSCIFCESSFLPEFYSYFSMVRTRGGSRLRSRVRFSTPERERPQLRSHLLYHHLSRPKIPVRPDWRIRTGFRDAKLRTGTLYLIFFFLKPNWCLWVMAHILKQNPNIIYKSKNYHRSGVHQKSRHI